MTQTVPQSDPPTLLPAKFTLEQYHRMVNEGILDGCPVELLYGVIVEMPPEGEPHANKSTQTGEYLMRLLGDLAQVRPAKPITLPNSSEPQPDLAIVQQLGTEYDRHHPYPENIFWVIEYSNTSLKKDLEIKSKIYAAVSILEYWVINLQTMELIVFREPSHGEYRSKVILTAGTIYPVAFPTMAIEVGRLGIC